MPATNPQLLTVDVGDDAAAWAAAGFAVASGPDGDLVWLGSTALRLTGRGGRVEGWALQGVTTPIDGLATTEPAGTGTADEADETDGTDGTDRAPGRTGGPPHPNGISRIDHVVVSSGDVERTVAAFGEAGFEVRGERSTTSYGSPMRQVFFWAGDVIVELIGPGVGEPVTEDATSVFGLALVADDLDTTAARLGELLSTPKDAVQPGRRIAGLRGAKVGISVPVAVMSPHERSADR
jgi:hypothetical protein